MDRQRLNWSGFFAAALMLVLVVPTAADAWEPPERDDDDEDSRVYAEEPDRPDPPLRRPVYDAGRFSIGVDGVFSRTSARAELIDAGVARDTTRFFRIDPWLTVGVMDHFHVGLRSGFVSRRVTQEGGDASSDNAVAVQPTAVYFIRVTDRLGLYGEAAPGMYFGRSERTIPAEDEPGDVIEDEETSTLGFVITLGTGINYRLSDGFQLRFGFAYNGLWGRETVEAIDETLSSSTTNIGTTAGFRYTF